MIASHPSEEFPMVLSCDIGERLVIDENIIVQIVNVNGRYAMIGIEAPRHIRIVRGELPRFEDGPPRESLAATVSPER